MKYLKMMKVIKRIRRIMLMINYKNNNKIQPNQIKLKKVTKSNN